MHNKIIHIQHPQTEVLAGLLRWPETACHNVTRGSIKLAEKAQC